MFCVAFILDRFIPDTCSSFHVRFLEEAKHPVAIFLSINAHTTSPLLGQRGELWFIQEWRWSELQGS